MEKLVKPLSEDRFSPLFNLHNLMFIRIFIDLPRIVLIIHWNKVLIVHYLMSTNTQVPYACTELLLRNQ